MMNEYESAPPRADAMIASMRAIGYDLSMAIADLIDNSILAGAKKIIVKYHWAGPNSWIYILDDGNSMTEKRLKEAMVLGSQSPDEERSPGDLGRFGLGLKTASFSQCKVLRRIAKKGPESASQLSRSLTMSPSNVTGIIDRLQNKGLVKRVPKIGDRRVMMITLTSAGKKTSESLPETAENRLVSGLENLEKSEVKKLSGALNTIIGLMKK